MLGLLSLWDMTRLVNVLIVFRFLRIIPIEDACRSSASAFFLEKLMIRVILRPAALLIEPFSSDRLLFFPLPVAVEMG